VRSFGDGIDIEEKLRHFEPGARMLMDALPDVLQGADREHYDKRAQELTEAGVPRELAHRTAAMPALPSVFDIVEIADATGLEPEKVMATYFRLGSKLELNWLRDRVIELPRANRWQALARTALRDDLYGLHRQLAQEVLQSADGNTASDGAIERWEQHNRAAISRYLNIISDIKASRDYDTTTLPVALREVRNLIHRGPSAEEPLTSSTEQQ
jgi:glutamate dehydrogenase